METQILKYICLLEYLLVKTKFCLENFEKLSSDQIEFEVENRSRIINQLQIASNGLHLTFENNKDVIQADNSLKSLIVAFQNDSELLYVEVDHLDRLLIERLEEQAVQTRSEIKQTFISSNRLKGYNLNQTK